MVVVAWWAKQECLLDWNVVAASSSPSRRRNAGLAGTGKRTFAAFVGATASAVCAR